MSIQNKQTHGKRANVVQMDDPVGAYDRRVDGDYNPADFVISGSDHQGHSERIWARVQPQHHRAIGVIMKSGNFPFKTDGDLVRWAVVRGLTVLDRLDPMPGFLGAAKAISEILQHEAYLQEMVEMFATMEKVINAHIASGAKGEARRLLTSILVKIRAIDEPHWKKKCEEDLMRRFGHLMEGGNKGKLRGGLVSHEEDDDE